MTPDIVEADRPTVEAFTAPSPPVWSRHDICPFFLPFPPTNLLFSEDFLDSILHIRSPYTTREEVSVQGAGRARRAFSFSKHHARRILDTGQGQRWVEDSSNKGMERT